MLKLFEPIRGVHLLQSLNAWMQTSQTLTTLFPILADIFVFVYPVYFLVLYIYGMATRQKYYKNSALFIFIGTILSIIINLGIQFFVNKTRPNFILGLKDLKQETILHNFLPTSSFPSDHAALSMGIAISSLIRGIKNKDKKFIYFGIILIIFSLIMGFSRIITAVHRPTDIIGGSMIGILIPLILLNKKLYRLLDRVFTWIGKII
ncbi:MAG: phosphatase PAP2 family protein [Candidatus Absconditabacterales bacterium]